MKDYILNRVGGGYVLVISLGSHKMLVRIANREGSDQTASSEAV